jgi:hypothetical protein
MMNKIIIVFLAMMVVSCSGNPEILSIKSITHSFQHAGKWQKEEYFIVVNPPRDIFKLAKCIADYNAATIIKDDLLTYSGWYSRNFYKKTSFTMKMYNTHNSNYAYELAQQYVDSLFVTHWSYSEEYGIRVGYSQLGNMAARDAVRWDVDNAKGAEIFYPWLRNENFFNKAVSLFPIKSLTTSKLKGDYSYAERCFSRQWKPLDVLRESVFGHGITCST